MLSPYYFLAYACEHLFFFFSFPHFLIRCSPPLRFVDYYALLTPVLCCLCSKSVPLYEDFQADGGRADTLFYNPTRACVYFKERVSARPYSKQFFKKVQFYLHISRKCCIFVVDFETVKIYTMENVKIIEIKKSVFEKTHRKTAKCDP